MDFFDGGQCAYVRFLRTAGLRFPDSLGNQQSREIALLTSVDRFYRRLYLLDEHSESSSPPTPDPIKLTVAFLLKAQLVSLLIWRVLEAEEGGSSMVIPQLYEMVQDLDSFIRISAYRKVVYEQKLYPGIVLASFTASVQVFLAAKDDQLIQQVVIVYELTPIIASAGFHAARCQEIGLPAPATQ